MLHSSSSRWRGGGGGGGGRGDRVGGLSFRNTSIINYKMMMFVSSLGKAEQTIGRNW